MIFQATTKKQLTLSNYRFINQYAFYKKAKNNHNSFYSIVIKMLISGKNNTS